MSMINRLNISDDNKNSIDSGFASKFKTERKGGENSEGKPSSVI